MPQKGKMRKIQPADDCGKYAAEKENEKKLRQIADCGILPQSGKMRDKGKRAHGNRPHRTLRLQLRWILLAPREIDCWTDGLP